MSFFDFHHHKKYHKGIYNLNFRDETPEHLFSTGIHPKDISAQWESDFSRVKEVSLNSNCGAIGECGLDGLIDVDEKLQETVFEKHILWANDVKKPVIIHCVRKFSQLIRFSKIAAVPLIVHGFNKKQSIADELVNSGFYLSFGRAVFHNVSLQTVVKDFPVERMFLETDDADFDIAELYEKVSELKNITAEDLQNQIFENLERIRNL